MSDRHRNIVDLHLIPRRPDGRVLLARRQSTGCGDGQLNLPSGHLESGETVVDGVIREAREEVGVTVDPADLRFAHVMHRAAETGTDRIGFFFLTDRWDGDPYNAEPGKCSELVWVDPAELPADTIAYPAAGIAHALATILCSTIGFPTDHAVTTNPTDAGASR